MPPTLNNSQGHRKWYQTSVQWRLSKYKVNGNYQNTKFEEKKKEAESYISKHKPTFQALFYKITEMMLPPLKNSPVVLIKYKQ